MDFLLYGPDLELRDKALDRIKKEVLGAVDAARLDFESLDSNKLSAEKLKIALYALPGIAPCRLVHLYRAEKLVKENLELILAFLQAEHSHAVLVLEAEEWDARAKMRSDVSRLLKLTGTEAPSVDSVFKLMDVAAAGNGVGALRGLSNLFGNDEDPARLLGGMVWAWSNNVKRRISPDVYKKGLLVLQEADIALKRSHFPEREHVLEVAVVKLSLLVKPLKA